jgi:uncharacterized protein (TIGR02001 family)
MNKKLLLVLLASLAAGITGSRAQSSGSWTFTPAVTTQYMFRGVRLGGPALQPAIEYGSGDLALGLWASFPLGDKVPGQSDPEFDFYGSYKVVAIKDTLVVQPGFTIYTYPNAKSANGFYKVTAEPNIALNYTVAGLALTPKLYYDFILEGPTAELSAAYSIPLKDAGTELAFAATIGTYKWEAYADDAVPDIKNWGNYWQAGVSMPFQITKDSKVTLGWAYVKGSDNFLKQGRTPQSANTAALGRGVVTVSWSVSL